MKPRVLVIDNYDSFTFNLVQRLGELGASVEVLRNDAESAATILAGRPERGHLPFEIAVLFQQKQTSRRQGERDQE